MNILCKGFDGMVCKPILDEALRGRKIGTFLFIGNNTSQMPDVDAQEVIWYPAIPLREGKYPDIHWHTITPLDEELVEAMAHCECVFLAMVGRYARYRDIPYEERRRQYCEHLRFWNHILITKAVDVCLFNTIPHQCYDIVLYDLCKLKNIPIYYIDRYYIVDGCALQADWKKSGLELCSPMEQLQKKYADENESIPLSPKFEEYFTSQTQDNVTPWYMFWRDEHLEQPSFTKKWSGVALRILIRKPKYFFSSIFSQTFWSRKLKQHHTTAFYDRHAQLPDLSVPYIYIPLQMEPEATTIPMSGVFADQELIVDLIAAALPPGIRIYIKEHPAQGELCRNEAFYASMLTHKSVTFVPRMFDTFQMSKHALAIATGTGTAAFEALFRGTPVLLFGHRFYQYAPGIFRICSKEDCARAFQTIVQGKGRPSERDARILLKAIEDSTVVCEAGPLNPHDSYTKEDKARIVGRYIHDSLQVIFPE
jgi:hypothetical protein